MIPRPLLAALLSAFTAIPALASPDSVVVFNEIQYNPGGPSEAGEYVELFNQMGIKTDISGWRIDGIGYTFPANTIIDPGAHVVVAKTPAAGQFGPFPGSIRNSGQRLRLINHSDRMMDEVDFGDDFPWPAGADGSGFTLAKAHPYKSSGPPAHWTVSAQPGGTPGARNFPDAGSPPPVTTVPLFGLDHTWRYNEKGPAFDATWATAAHAVGGSGADTWAVGSGALAYEVSGTVPIGTALTFPGFNSPFVMTYYFETEFNVTANQLANLSLLKIRHALDDGAVIYINGVEATRINMPAGTITSETTASTNVEAGTTLSASLPLPATALIAGSNRLSVEVHQSSLSNSDVVWGAQLDMDVRDSVPGAAPELRFNEIPASTMDPWWVEITNTGSNDVDLTGTIISAGDDAALEHVIPSGSLAAGGLLLLTESVLGFRPADGEKVFLYTAGKTALMDARQQTGRLRGRATSRGGDWAYPSTATPGTTNDFVFNDSIVISEIQYNPPSLPPTATLPLRSSDNQWLELTNRSATTVSLAGWELAEGVNFAFAPGTVLAPGERACVVRDPVLFSAAYPAARVLGTWDGALSRSTEEVVLRDGQRNTVDAVRYYDGGQWPRFGDGGGASIELRDLHADNNAGSSWAASDESSRTEWKTYSYRGTATASNGGPDGTWREFNMGLLSAGELWIDDLRVIEQPSGAATPKITDSAFNNASAWRCTGNHRSSEVIPEPGNPSNNILRLVATGPTEHINNHIATTLSSPVTNSREYEISFRARWVTGAHQLHTRLYFNRLARVNVIDRVAHPGTPGAANSRAEANAGPTFTHLKHSPAVPDAGAVTTIYCTAGDPDTVSAVTLYYSVNGAAFASTAMASSGGGNYTGSIPGQAAGAVVQFYVRGTDGSGFHAFHPAAGPDSRALYKVNDNKAATTGWHNFRIITTNAERTWMHTNYNTMSNDLIGCTVIDRENDIYYGVGVHLKSSERGRNQLTRVGYNLTFPPDGMFRGVHDSLNLDRSEGQAPGQRELLFDVMISNAGGPISRFNDFIKLLAPNNSLTGGAVLQMARYEDSFLEEQFEDGAEGHLYEYELVYYPTSADSNQNKLYYPSPDGVIGLPFSNHGNDPERYRWHFMNKNHREADNFTPLMNYAKMFSKSGAAFEADVKNLIDLDGWFRGLSCAVLSGATDNFGGDGSQHNAWFYARPDGRVIFLPHDMDNGFNSGLTLFNNPQCVALTANPARRRQYLAHLHDIISRTYNNKYMSTWTSHFAALDPSQPWASHLNYITSRSNSVLSQIKGQIPSVDFSITTASPQTVAASTATVAGNGWVNVREIRIAGSPEPLTVTWTGKSTWQAIVPAAPGSHEITLEAVDFAGAVIGAANITINNTTTVQPGSASNLVVSEIMYHPADPTPTEIANGFVDSDQFEWIELQNIGAAVVDMTGVRFTDGIDYAFTPGTTLQPGQRIVVARERAAFLTRHPGAAAALAAGAFTNALNNGGEPVQLTGANGLPVKSFAYDDDFPWPAAADGQGPSLVLIAPSTNPDHTMPANWRPSAHPGGNPGASDSIPFTGDPGGDIDGDGFNDLIEHALGPNPIITYAPGPEGFTFTLPMVPSADDALISGQVSTTLTGWVPADLIGSTSSSLTFRVPPSLSTANQIFFRANVRLR
ncbi:MAG: lamin tail domain-containing protein [Verrucomicrobiales bacterium]